MPLPIRLVLVLSVLLAGAGCSSFSDEEQQAFETAAFYLQPEGYTEVSAMGEVGSRDADDWRSAPVFAGRASVLTPPTPNPATRGTTVRLLIDTQGVPGGLALYARDARGDLILLDDRPDATEVGFYELAFFGSEAAAGRGDGLYRLIVLDGAQRVVTYGDLRVEG